MPDFLSMLFGGNKSQKDVKKINPLVEKTNGFFKEFQNLSNDELRGKTRYFKEKIAQYTSEIDAAINQKKTEAEELDSSDISGRDALYQLVDELGKERDKKIEEVLMQILPEAFAVVKETARRFKENTELVSSATDLDRDLSVTKP